MIYLSPEHVTSDSEQFLSQRRMLTCPGQVLGIRSGKQLLRFKTVLDVPLLNLVDIAATCQAARGNS